MSAAPGATSANRDGGRRWSARSGSRHAAAALRRVVWTAAVALRRPSTSVRRSPRTAAPDTSAELRPRSLEYVRAAVVLAYPVAVHGGFPTDHDHSRCL